KLPLVSGSALRWEGQLTVYNYGEGCPCYRCLFPNPPDPTTVTNCNEGGVLGPIVGVIGSMQALEVMKIAGNLPGALSKQLLLYDGRDGKSRVIRLRSRNPNCAVCGENPTVTAPIDYVVFCGAGAHDKN
uniref:ThiF domain-containing protein n=1 Tax=Caenorhabditis japonica TaxID=281687 RepID=A0A8R1IV14_CAEJA